MTDEDILKVKEILSRLERIDHKEYSCGFEFADSSTFDETARCFEERKILAKEIERLNNKIQDLQADYGNMAQVERDLLKEENKRLNNIINKAKKETTKQLKGAITQEFTDLKKILYILKLKGEDKE